MSVILAPVIQELSFLRTDLSLLAERYTVREVRSRTPREMLAILAQVPSADLVFCWFGSLRFLPVVALARLLGKPVAIVTGGYDVAAEHAIGYGNMRGGVTAWLGRLVLRLATLCLPYSEAGQDETTRNARIPLAKQRLIYLGFAPEAPPPDRPRKRQAVTVGRIDASTIHRKGILTVARMGRLAPDIEVVIAGKADPEPLAELQAAAGPNVRFTGFISDADLRTLLQESAVYVQASIHEAFGCALAEGMLEGCVPVVTRQGSLPEVVGDTGAYVPPDDPAALAAAVRQMIDQPPGGPEGPRARIERLYSLDRRRQALHAVIDELLAD
ncbi:MAG: glycosyltransferase family 4 protein [Gemmatimonadales bacterium]